MNNFFVYLNYFSFHLNCLIFWIFHLNYFLFIWTIYMFFKLFFVHLNYILFIWTVFCILHIFIRTIYGSFELLFIENWNICIILLRSRFKGFHCESDIEDHFAFKNKKIYISWQCSYLFCIAEHKTFYLKKFYDGRFFSGVMIFIIEGSEKDIDKNVIVTINKTNKFFF